jgi:hypothetical protein
VCQKWQLGGFYQELRLAFTFEAGGSWGLSAGGCPTCAVHLVDEGEARDAIPPHLPVHRDGLALHPAHRAQHQHRAVQHPQRPLHLQRQGLRALSPFVVYYLQRHACL